MRRFHALLPALLLLAAPVFGQQAPKPPQAPPLWADAPCACRFGPCACVACECPDCGCDACPGKADPVKPLVAASCSVRSGVAKYNPHGKVYWDSGSAVCIHADPHKALLLTNAHVIGTYGDTVTAKFPSGKEVKARPVYVSHYYDVTILRADKPGPLPSVPLHEYDANPGDALAQVGYPAPKHAGHKEKLPVVRKGKAVALKWRATDTVKRYELYADFDPPTRSGDSGSGIFFQGKVVGLVWGWVGTPQPSGAMHLDQMGVPGCTLRYLVDMHGHKTPAPASVTNRNTAPPILWCLPG